MVETGSPYRVGSVVGICVWCITSCIIVGYSSGIFGLCSVHYWNKHDILGGVVGKSLDVSVCKDASQLMY